MNRWTPLELAEVLSRNPHVKLATETPCTALKTQSATIARPGPVGVASASKAAQHAPKQDYKAMLVQQCELVGLRMEPEFKFLPDRKFRADWRVGPKKLRDFVKSRVLVEYDGGIFSSGKRGHSSVNGIRRDQEKSNLAQIAGWVMIRVSADHVTSGQALKWIEAALTQGHVAQ